MRGDQEKPNKTHARQHVFSIGPPGSWGNLGGRRRRLLLLGWRLPHPHPSPASQLRHDVRCVCLSASLPVCRLLVCLVVFFSFHLLVRCRMLACLLSAQAAVGFSVPLQCPACKRVPVCTHVQITCGNQGYTTYYVPKYVVLKYSCTHVPVC